MFRYRYLTVTLALPHRYHNVTSSLLQRESEREKISFFYSINVDVNLYFHDNLLNEIIFHHIVEELNLLVVVHFSQIFH